jgi:hypothetical protein
MTRGEILRSLDERCADDARRERARERASAGRNVAGAPHVANSERPRDPDTAEPFEVCVKKASRHSARGETRPYSVEPPLRTLGPPPRNRAEGATKRMLAEPPEEEPLPLSSGRYSLVYGRNRPSR